MQKKVYRTTIHTLLFIAFATFMPGFVVANGPFGKILLGVIYAMVFFAIDDVLHFFKLPRTTMFRVSVGLLLICLLFYFITSQFPKFLIITTGYIGSTDFIIFTLPRLITLDTQATVIFASAIILMLCSIIIEKLKK